MTSVTYSRRCTWAAAAALTGALVLAGCSDDGGAPDGKASPTPTATATADTGGADGTDGGPSASATAAAGSLEGSWLGTADGEAVVLMVTGGKAALYATGGTVCSGSAGGQAGARTIRLSCASGKKTRTTGTVDSVNGSTLRVTWQGGAGQETYTKAESGGGWPSGLPTTGLGS